jgi:outer membrane protein OmpA-like peptidoglycan-associated protein
MRLLSSLMILSVLTACAAKPEVKKDEFEPEVKKIILVEYEKKTKELLATTQKLNDSRGQLDDQRRRLMVICTDYPDHTVCLPQTAATYARDAFCKDPEFTGHVNAVVNACHQGECKQVDQAEQISRSQYMLLTQRLPHSLVLFGPSKTRLDRRDKKQMQQFLEVLQGEKGYVIIVGRASKDGNWRKNLKLALKRAENTRKYLVESMGISPDRVGFITYGDQKMYLTRLDAERFSAKKISEKQANRSALVFSYPCFDPIR